MSKDKSFSEYYKYYLTLHKNNWCRRFHVFGQIATLASLYLIISNKIWPLLVLVPFVVYPFAWFGHFYFEKNEPAAWSNPLWAKACDWIMFRDILFGRIKW